MLDFPELNDSDLTVESKDQRATRSSFSSSSSLPSSSSNDAKYLVKKQTPQFREPRASASATPTKPKLGNVTKNSFNVAKTGQFKAASDHKHNELMLQYMSLIARNSTMQLDILRFAHPNFSGSQAPPAKTSARRLERLNPDLQSQIDTAKAEAAAAAAEVSEQKVAVPVAANLGSSVPRKILIDDDSDDEHVVHDNSDSDSDAQISEPKHKKAKSSQA